MDKTDLRRIVRTIAQRDDNFFWSGNHVDFDSWSGRISRQDVEALGLGFRVVGPSVPMIGPCGMLFGRAVILADGKVNACVCRAVDKEISARRRLCEQAAKKASSDLNQDHLSLNVNGPAQDRQCRFLERF